MKIQKLRQSIDEMDNRLESKLTGEMQKNVVEFRDIMKQLLEEAVQSKVKRVEIWMRLRNQFKKQRNRWMSREIETVGVIMLSCTMYQSLRNIDQKIETKTTLKTDRKWKFQFRPKPKVTPKAGYDFRPKLKLHRKRPPAFGRNPKPKPKVHATYHYTHVSGCGPE